MSLTQSVNFQICAAIRHKKNGIRDGGSIKVNSSVLMGELFILSPMEGGSVLLFQMTVDSFFKKSFLLYIILKDLSVKYLIIMMGGVFIF